ncbi:MAG: dihydroorotase [Candidatus Eisenbacteria bacterium]|uniref:Dihydroorotase n=1 Tax=Eiseniibacteriota bacterium TaxID=2212470 RepID=A0A948W5K9_UNCEI|nr:dihydroorotase [Candidatus Eisenbacteria bacterium]MBU2689696.1 dihydroorotase [Candidatus Eisenbacteria bacterium]
MDLVGGRVVDPDGPLNRREGLRIVDGRLVEPGDQADLESDLMIDLQGGLLTPGLSDMHVHLREPGYEDAETVATGLRAAARGGFTRVACMPNTNPPVDQRSVVELLLARAREACGVHLHPVGAVTRGLKSDDLTEMAELKEAGVTAVSNDGFPVFSSRTMRRAMEYAKTFDMLIISHAEDEGLKGDGVMNEGYWSTVLGLRGIPAAAEEIAVMRDIALSRLTGCRLHIAHVSTAGSVDAIRRAKAEGVPVTAETAPHYFTLTHAALQSYDANFKMNPPLRTERDVEAILQGIVDGTLDVIATDHAPHSQEKKEVELDQASFGIIGLETSLGLVMTHLLRPGRVGAEDLVRLMSQRAAKIMGWNSGHLRAGELAELTLIDPQATWTVDPELFASKSRNCPFGGWELQGRAALTVVEGRLVHWEKSRAEADSGLLVRAL